MGISCSSMRRAVCLAFALVTLLALLAVPARGATCPHQDAVRVPGAEQQAPCLADLTTAGTVATGHTDAGDWAGLTPRARNPQRRPRDPDRRLLPRHVDDQHHRGWNHDAQFVIRLPERVERRARRHRRARRARQYATDSMISAGARQGLRLRVDRQGQQRHQLLQRRREPGDAIAEWHRRVTELTVAAKRSSPAVRPRARPHVRRRHLQRRLPDALAAREPARALRRRRRLGGHALAPRRRRTCSPTCPPRCATTRVRATGDEAAHDAIDRGGLRRPGPSPVGRPLRGLLGSHPAHLPRGARPRLRRRRSRAASRSAARGRRTATPTTTTRPAAGGRATRVGKRLAHRPDRQADDHAARHARRAAADRAPTPTSTSGWSARRAAAACTATTSSRAATTSTGSTTRSRTALRPILAVLPQRPSGAGGVGRAWRVPAAGSVPARPPAPRRRRRERVLAAGGGGRRRRRPVHQHRAGRAPRAAGHPRPRPAPARRHPAPPLPRHRARAAGARREGALPGADEADRPPRPRADGAPAGAARRAASRGPQAGLPPRQGPRPHPKLGPGPGPG